MEFLTKIRPPRFLRYIFYRLYIFGLKTNNRTPELSASITLAFTHFIQLLLIILSVGAILGKDYWGVIFEEVNRVVLAVMLLVFLYVVEIFYQHGNKFKTYISEFESETEAKHKRGTIYLILYLVLSIPISLFIIGYIIISFSPYYH